MKSGEVLRESRLVFFEWSGGGNENQLVLLGCAWSFLCRVRLLFDFVLWLFRDGLLLFVLGFLISAPLSPF